MEMTLFHSPIIELLGKTLDRQQLTTAESVRLEQWKFDDPRNLALYNELADPKSLTDALKEFGDPDTEASLIEIRYKLFEERAVQSKTTTFSFSFKFKLRFWRK